uniref:Very-long-chain 3-oxoacyl-CoA synthase n=1 Tax=Tetranychus urticae TaxID=32264 RepID=T1K6Y2_TETUR
MSLEKLTIDYHLEKLFGIEGSSDPRTNNLATFYCKIWLVALFYAVLSPLYLKWLPRFKKTKGKYQPMEAFIVIYNGFMFGCYGTGVAVAYWATNGLNDFFDCTPIDKNASDPKSIMIILMGIILVNLKMVRFFEPLMYKIAGKEPPFSGILTIDGIIVHCLAMLAIKYQCGNFFTAATFLEGIAMVLYYAHQTLKCGGFIPEYYLTWHHMNITLQILVRYAAYKHAVWGFENPQCSDGALRPLINIQYWGAILSLCFYVHISRFR